MTVQEALKQILTGEDLSFESAGEVMGHLMLGEVHHGLMGGFLVGMEAKGVTGDELAGFAKSMRSFAVSRDFGVEGLVDNCGTGGGRATFNLSTGAAILAASAGAKVAKHGNRAVTSMCGSADVLEQLGVPIGGTDEEQAERLKECGFLFMFAPDHHPAVRHVAPVRKALGVRTFFNMIGPLSNPAGANRQMVGVFSEKSMKPMAEALARLGVEEAYVVHGTDGMDEVSPMSETLYMHVANGKVTSGSWTPGDFGVSGITDDDLKAGQTVVEGGELLKSALDGSHPGRAAALVPNTAVTLLLAGVVDSVGEGAEKARAALKDGLPMATVAKLRGK